MGCAQTDAARPRLNARVKTNNNGNFPACFNLFISSKSGENFESGSPDFIIKTLQAD